MLNRNIVILQKMVAYCDDAVKYSKGLSYEAFIENELYLTFSVFSLSQLGELSSKLDQEIREHYPTIPWQALRGIRNRIVHDYDGVKFRILWDVLTKNIEPLKRTLIDVIAELDIKE